MHGAFTIPFSTLGLKRKIRVSITKFGSTFFTSLLGWLTVGHETLDLSDYT